MSASERRRRRRLLLLTAWWVLLASNAAAQQATLTIHEATFNALADAVGPMAFEQTPPPIEITYKLIKFKWGFIPVGITTHTLKICENRVAKVKVHDLGFDIRTSDIEVEGETETHWCGQTFRADVNGSATVALDPDGPYLRVQVSTDPVRPKLKISLPGWLGGDRFVTMPFTIDVGPSLTLPPILIHTAAFDVESARGAHTLRVTGRDLELAQQSGRIVLRARMVIW